ncbi:MAG: ferrochelatase [Acidimicrobiales bacterium]
MLPDSILLVSFGGPDGPADVVPFLEHVTRGRDIAPERLAVVAEHYALFQGISPINGQNRDLLRALRADLEAAHIDLPVYWGNRNWNPLLTDVVSEMVAAGHKRILAIVTSAFGSYSGCRQYSEDLSQAIESVAAPIEIVKARLYWNHPGFLAAMTDRINGALDTVDPQARTRARLVFTAHSIPTAWITTAPYVDQLRAAAGHLASSCAPGLAWDLVFQSRSGPPHAAWLEPDIVDHLEQLHSTGQDIVVVIPLGFISDHMEVVYDLDVQARARADELGVTMIRVDTVGTHPAFVAALRGLVEEHLAGTPPLTAIGEAWPNPCPHGCCVIAAE